MKNPFANASALEKVGEHRFTWKIPADWVQGRAPFGGLVSGTALKAMLEFVPEGRLVRSMYTSFIAPAKVDIDTHIDVELLRSGKSLTHVQARVIQGEQVCTIVVANFGADHERELRIEPAPAPKATDVDELMDMPFIEGIVPTFTQHFAYRWTVDSVPYSGADKAVAQGWFRLRDTETLGYPELVALLDAWPPPILSMAQGPIPASSATWMLNFFHPLTDENNGGDDWWFFDSHSGVSMGGYADTDAKLYDKNGSLVACSRQLAVEFS